MFHKAINLEYGDGTMLELTFSDGKVKRYDMSALFGKYPQLTALRDRALFTSGKLLGSYGIVWNDDLDVEAETVYEDGETVREEKPAAFTMVGNAVAAARARKGLSQKELSELTGIDQSDLSKIERGIANPSVNTLNRIAQALEATLIISLA
ncbi:MAG: helix-turn-helix domain-containing protein [Clostridia bacterium]|nr:helix-turn-helix domain-containing protein [Clostridia bacterium]